MTLSPDKDNVKEVLIREFSEEFCYRNVSQSSHYDIGGNHRAQEARDWLLQAFERIEEAGRKAERERIYAIMSNLVAARLFDEPTNEELKSQS